MPIRLTNPVLSASGFSKTYRLVTVVTAIIVAAGLLALGIVAPSLDNGKQALAQSGNSACVTAPQSVELRSIDKGIIVQWDVCPDEWSSDRRYRYESRYVIRWRATTTANSSDWLRTTNAGSNGEFRITGLTNGLQYAVQLRPNRVEVEVDDQGRFVDERIVSRGSWTGSYFATPGQNIDTSCYRKSGEPAEPRNVELWEHDSGILVQWDVCPNHSYEIRWRRTTDTVNNPYNWWTNTVPAGRSGQFDIPDDTPDTKPFYINPNAPEDKRIRKYLAKDDVRPLVNGQRYVVQLRPIYVEDNRPDEGLWTDDFFAEPQRCGDLPDAPSGISVLTGDSKLLVSWYACDGMRNQVRWRPKDGNWGNYVDVGENESYTVEGLANGSEYEVEVRSTAPSSGPLDKLTGEPYSTDWGRDSGMPTSMCPDGDSVVPKEFVVVPGDGKLFVSWRPCADHKYQLQYGTSYGDKTLSGTDWTDPDWMPPVSVALGNHTIRGLDNKPPLDSDYEYVRYLVQVRSQRDGKDPSGWTGTYQATPQDPPPNNRSPGWKHVPRSLSLVESQNYDEPIATIEAADPNRGDDRIRYEIVKPFPEPEIFPFAINVRDGEIYLYDTLDYEVIEEYEFTVRAVDLSGIEIESEIRIEVIDAAGPPPPILYRVCSMATGVEVDWSGDDSKYDYELQRRLGSADANRPVWIDTPDDEKLDLSSIELNDLERNTEWVFRVRSVNGEQSKWSSEEGVFVGGVANRAPEFRRDSYEFEVIEEQRAGVHVGFTVANDPDRFSSLRFQIVESTPEDAPFAVNPFTGIVTTSDRLDFEVQNSYSLVIRATDLCGASDYVDVTITVLDDPNIDATPLVPSAPSIIAKHDQVVVIWPTDHYVEYDLDWREVGKDYRSRPEDTDATMPRVVDLPDTDSSYAFRLRRVNQLGEPGEWSPETIVDPDVTSPTIEPIDVPRQGQVLGGVEMYVPGITLKEGQTARLGFNMFGIDGSLDNSLIDRRDVTALWRVSDGDLSDDRGRVVSYTAPDDEGVYEISIVVKQTVPGGIVQRNLDIAVHVVGSKNLIKPFRSGGEVPRNFEVNGVTYGAISYFEAKEYRPPAASKAFFKVREGSIPSYEWIGVLIEPGESASTLQSKLDGYTAVGDIFTSQFVSKDGAPIINMSFISSAAMCLPVPVEWTDSLQSLVVMRITPSGELAMMDLPVRFQPNPTFNDPALVCGHSEVFDGQMFLGIANKDIVTPTPTLTPTPIPTDTPTVTPTIEPTAIPTDTATPTPTPDPLSVVVIGTSTSTPTPTPEPVPATPTFTATPAPTATHTPAPTSTPTSTPTPTSEPTATVVPTKVPTATSVPTDTPAPVVKSEATATVIPTATETAVPTSTAVPTEAPTSIPDPTQTPVPTVALPAPSPTVEHDSPSDDRKDEGTPLVSGDSDDSVSVSLIVIAVIAFVILGVAIASYIVYNNRVSRQLAGAPKPEKLPVGGGTDEVVPEDEDDPVDDDDNSEDDSRYDALRFDR